MIHYEREVKEVELICAMLDEMDQVHLGMMDEDGLPYVVPLNSGHEFKDNKLYIYTHFTKRGHKLELLKKNPKVCAQFSIFNDFPDRPYKKHRHDYRSVIAKGEMHIIDYKENPEVYTHGYNLLYTCNNREIVPLESRKVIPPMYIGMIICEMNQVAAKSEFPLRKVEDVPFINVYDMPIDETPFDISVIIEKEKKGFINNKRILF